MTESTESAESRSRVQTEEHDRRRPAPTVWLEEVFRAHAGFVANTLRRFGVAPADLPDQIQEVFIVVHGLCGAYDAARPIRPWLFGIAYRVAGRYRDARGARNPSDVDDVTLVDPAPLADERLEAREAKDLVLAALERVELSRRAVFLLADLEGESIPTIAETLQIPLNTAYSRLRLAREEFARAVAVLRRREGGSR